MLLSVAQLRKSERSKASFACSISMAGTDVAGALSSIVMDLEGVMQGAMEAWLAANWANSGNGIGFAKR